MAAIDDLAIELDAKRTLNRVYIRNKSTSKWIVLSIEIKASPNFDLWRVTRSASRKFGPQEFEVRIPAGQRAYIGNDKFQHFRKLNPDGHNDIELVAVDTSIVRATYIADERIILPTLAEAESTLFMYEADLVATGEMLYFFVDMNRVFGITFTLTETHSGQSWNPGLNNAMQMYWYHGDSGRRFSISNATFFAVNPLAITDLEMPDKLVLRL